MGKLDKEQEARMAGMRYALGIAKEKGVDGLQHSTFNITKS